MKKLILVLLALLLYSPAPARATLIHRTYANMVFGNNGIRGLEVWPGMATQYQDELRQAHPYWVKTSLRWSEVEVTQGVYSWPANFDADYNTIYQAGGDMIVVLKTAPAWARTDPRHCGRITAAKIPAFAEFARRAALRYPSVLIWEVWNEEDLDTVPAGAEDYNGCWGDPNDSYYGGGYYASVINPVKVAIHSASPKAKVYFGGLAIPSITQPIGKYFEGALRAGAKFDGVSFHYYVSYPNTWVSPQNKVNFIRQLMAQYNKTRPILLSEVSLLSATGGEAFEQAQGQFVHWVWDETKRMNLQAFIWYSLPDSGWYHAALLEGERLKPAFYEFAVYDD
jgi:hypothetical protein